MEPIDTRLRALQAIEDENLRRFVGGPEGATRFGSTQYGASGPSTPFLPRLPSPVTSENDFSTDPSNRGVSATGETSYSPGKKSSTPYVGGLRDPKREKFLQETTYAAHASLIDAGYPQERASTLAPILAAQSAHESGYGESRLASELNNLGGRKGTQDQLVAGRAVNFTNNIEGGESPYLIFDSVGDYYKNQISYLERRFPGALKASTTSEFISGLRPSEGSQYFQDTISNYQTALDSAMPHHGSGSGSGYYEQFSGFANRAPLGELASAPEGGGARADATYVARADATYVARADATYVAPVIPDLTEGGFTLNNRVGSQQSLSGMSRDLRREVTSNLLKNSPLLGLAYRISPAITNLLASTATQTAGVLTSGLGFATRYAGGRGLIGVGRDIREAGDRVFPKSEVEDRGGQLKQEALEEIRAQATGREAPEGASGLQRYTREVAFGIKDHASALATVMRGDPEAALAYLGGVTVRNAPNTAIALAAFAYGGVPFAFAASLGLESGALSQELDAFVEGEGRDVTFSEEMAVLGGSTAAAALDVVGARAVMGAARRVATGTVIKKGAKNRFLKDVAIQVKRAGIEIPTEMAQEIIANSAAKVGWDPTKDLGEGVIEAGIASGPTVFAAGTIGAIRERRALASEKLEIDAVAEAMIADPEGTMADILQETTVEEAVVEEVISDRAADLPQPAQQIPVASQEEVAATPPSTPTEEVVAEQWTDEEAKSLAKDIRGGGSVTLEEAQRHPRTLKAFLAGSPPRVSTASDHVKTEERIRDLALFGVEGRFWYEKSGEDILRLTRNRQDADKLIKLIAITSPQNAVPGNWNDALQIWSEYKESLRTGERVEFTGGARSWMNLAAKKLLYEGKDWSGLKTNSFYQNIMAVMNEVPTADVTIDMWMMRAIEYKTDSPTPAQYRYAKRTINDVAQSMGWKGWQVQAAAWETTKHLTEQKGVKDMSTVDLTQYDPTELRSVDFSTVAKKRRALVSIEAVPGRSTGAMPGIHEAPLEQQREYTAAMWGALHNDKGNNILFDYFGVLAEDSPNVLSGYWKGDTNPVMQVHVQAVPAEGSSEAKGVRVTPTLHIPGLRGTDKTTLAEVYGDTSTKEARDAIAEAFQVYINDGSTGNAAVDAVFESKIKKQDIFKIQAEQQRAINGLAASLGRLFKQEAVGWHRPVYNADAKQADGSEFTFESGRTISSEELGLIADQIDADLGAGASDNVALISTKTGFRVLSFGLFDNNQEFQVYIGEAVNSALDEATTQGEFARVGDLLTNDWEVNPNGEGYTDWIAAAGSSDFQGRILDTVSRQIAEVNRNFSERYGWDDRAKYDTKSQRAAKVKVGETKEAEEAGTPPTPPPPPSTPTEEAAAADSPERAIPHRALQGNEDTQRMLNEADQIMLDDGLIEDASHDLWNAEADRMLAEDASGHEARVFEHADAIEGGADVKMQIKIMDTNTSKAAVSGVDSDWAKTQLQGIIFRGGGTKASHVMLARQLTIDDNPSSFVNLLIAAPDAKTERQIRKQLGIEDPSRVMKGAKSAVKFAKEGVAKKTSALSDAKNKLQEVRKAETPQRVKIQEARVAKAEEQLKAATAHAEVQQKHVALLNKKIAAKVKKLTQKGVKESKAITAKLKEMGVDITDKAFMSSLSRSEAARVMIVISTMKSSAGSQIFEYFINGLLSGVPTHMANLVSNIGMTAWDVGPQRWTEIAVAESIRTVERIKRTPLEQRKKGLPRAGELSFIYKAILNGGVYKSAWARGKVAFDLEQSFRTGKNITEGKFDVTHSMASIPGKTGRVIRVPGRLLRFSDEAAKGVISNIHIGTFAYRIAKDEGLSDQPLTDRMTGLMNDPASLAWQDAHAKADYLTWTKKLGVIGEDMIKAAKLIRGHGWVVPFMRIMANIAKTGFRKTPLGLPSLAIRAGADLIGKSKYGLKGRGVELVSEQITAALLSWAVFVGATSEDDQGRPYITGSADRSSRGSIATGRNSAIQPQSFLLWGTYYSYARWEPFATMFSVMVDLSLLWNNHLEGKPQPDIAEAIYDLSIGAARDKTFARSLSEAISIAESGEDALTWFSHLGASIAVPRIVPLAAKATDAFIRDTRIKGEGPEWLRDYGRKAVYKAFPFADLPFGLTPPIAVDVWGNDAKKFSTENMGKDFALRMVFPRTIRDTDMYIGDLFIANYNKDFPNEPWAPSNPNPSISRESISYDLTDDQYREFLILRGKRAKEDVEYLIRSGEIHPKNPTIEEKDFVKKAFTDATKYASGEIFFTYFDKGHDARFYERQDEVRAPRQN